MKFTSLTLFLFPFTILWLVLGIVKIPTLWKITFLQEYIPNEDINIEWLVNDDWALNQVCEKEQCRSKTIEESQKEFSIVANQVEFILTSRKVLEIMEIARKDSQVKESPCFNTTLTICLEHYAEGLSKQVNSNISTDEAFEIMNKLKAISIARQGGTVYIPNDTPYETIRNTALALKRDIGDIPLSTDKTITDLYKQSEKADE